MGVQFTIGHVGGGTEHVDLLPSEIDAVIISLLEELYDSDDEHYQGYIVSSTGTGMTIFDGGLMAWRAYVSGSATATQYYRPAMQAEAVEILNAFVQDRPEKYASRFSPEIPPPRPWLNFLLIGMGEFALNRAAWSGNFTRVKELVEAGHDVNQQTPDGATPLMGAVSEGFVGMCQFLIEHGADVTVRLPSDGFVTDNWSLLRLARREGVPGVVQLLEAAGAPE